MASQRRRRRRSLDPCERRGQKTAIVIVVPMSVIRMPPNAGYVGIEVRGIRAVDGRRADRIDVKELPALVDGEPVLEAIATKQVRRVTLAVTRHEDLDVLVAMSDVCEAAPRSRRTGGRHEACSWCGTTSSRS
jgi:hypothetical protein